MFKNLKFRNMKYFKWSTWIAAILTWIGLFINIFTGFHYFEYVFSFQVISIIISVILYLVFYL